MLSTAVEYDVVHYLDSEKVGVRAKDFRLMVRGDAGVDYMEGED
jgi:hypothetical protein